MSENERQRVIEGSARVPPGQRVTTGFPVLSYGATPRLGSEDWKFRVFGLVEHERQWDWEGFLALGRVTIRADFHCVTSWSRLDNSWTGVPTARLIEEAGVKAGARYVMVHCHGGYTTNMPLEAFAAGDSLFAHMHDGRPLEPDHGGPMRLVVPQLYAWKSAKWVSAIEFMARDRRGFWESNGYSNSADPWTEDRYS